MVVINGPVARAGLISYLSKTRGTKVPKIVAKTITDISAIPTVKPN
jgi:hypothetical protein